jgi:hypothetical protein
MKNADLFQDNASLTSEYWDIFSRKREWEPEKRLLVAILDSGIRSYRQCLFTNRRRFLEAEEWLFGNDEAPFSFSYICDVLGLNTGCIREMVLGRKTHKPGETARKKKPAPARHVSDVSAHEKKPEPKTRYSYDGAWEGGTPPVVSANGTDLDSTRGIGERAESIKCPISR